MLHSCILDQNTGIRDKCSHFICHFITWLLMDASTTGEVTTGEAEVPEDNPEEAKSVNSHSPKRNMEELIEAVEDLTDVLNESLQTQRLILTELSQLKSMFVRKRQKLGQMSESPSPPPANEEKMEQEAAAAKDD